MENYTGLEIVQLPNFFRLAKVASTHSDYKVRMGACIVVRGTVVSFGFNKIKTHPYFADHTTIHAEARAIWASGKEKIIGSSIFIYRQHGKNKLPVIAKPCAKCMELIRKFGCKYVFYTTSNFPFWEMEKIQC